MPTFNRCNQLQSVLPSYLASPLVQEVIIVDDASTDHTESWATGLADSDTRVKYLRNIVNRGLPATRNRGVAQSTGTWVLHTEDDLALGEDCLETLFEHAESHKADIIAGRRIWVRIGESEAQALQRANTGPQWLFNEWLLEHNSHALTESDIETPLLNATMLVRRHVADTIQHFEKFGGQSSWREDSDYQISALEAGYRLLFCPHAVSFHYSRTSQSFGRNRIKGTAVYAYRVFRNNLAFLRRHRAYLRTHYPKSLLLGSPLLSASMYGVYRTTWLLAAEAVRFIRTRRHGGYAWN